MRYVPAGAVGLSVTEPPAVPPEMLQVKVEPAGNPLIVQARSFPLNPKPETPTVPPGRATFGEIVTWAIGVPTVKIVDAEKKPSVTVIT